VRFGISNDVGLSRVWSFELVPPSEANERLSLRVTNLATKRIVARSSVHALPSIVPERFVAETKAVRLRRSDVVLLFASWDSNQVTHGALWAFCPRTSSLRALPRRFVNADARKLDRGRVRETVVSRWADDPPIRTGGATLVTRLWRYEPHKGRLLRETWRPAPQREKDP
jgi:hypothetical protein